jgi:hypothetical protein
MEGEHPENAIPLREWGADGRDKIVDVPFGRSLFVWVFLPRGEFMGAIRVVA